MIITEQELDHLAELSKLKLSPEEKKMYLKNMDSIIQFLDQLKAPIEEVYISDDEKLECFTGTDYFENPESLLENSNHKKGEFIGVKTAFPK